MGWLLELLVEIVGVTAADAVVSRMSARGCFLVLIGLAALVLFFIWLGS